MRRRQLLALIAAAGAAPGLAMAGPQTVPIDKAFPFLAGYLALAPAQRTRFYLAYRAYRDKRPTGDAHATIIAPTGVRTPVGFDRLGNVLRLPTLADLKSGATVEIDGAPFQLGPEVRCAMAASTRIDAGEIELALAQLNIAVGKLAGALSFVVPKMTAAFFPDGGGGQAVTADGRAVPLPVFVVPAIGPVPYVEPATVAGIKAIAFQRPPSRILLGGHPKKS